MNRALYIGGPMHGTLSNAVEHLPASTSCIESDPNEPYRGRDIGKVSPIYQYRYRLEQFHFGLDTMYLYVPEHTDRAWLQRTTR